MLCFFGKEMPSQRDDALCWVNRACVAKSGFPFCEALIVLLRVVPCVAHTNTVNEPTSAIGKEMS